MKKCIFLILIFTKLFAQQMPIAESNAFVYNKINYGNDFLNGKVHYNNDQSGSVFFQPYNGAIFEIGNTISEQSIHYKNNSYPALQKVISSSTTKYYCTFKSIIAVTKNKSKTTFLLNKNKEYASNFEKIGNAIYFLNNKLEDNGFISINKFDGKKVVVLRKLSAKDVVFTDLISAKDKLYYLVATTFSTRIFEVYGYNISIVKEYFGENKIVQIFNFIDLENFDFLALDEHFCSVRKGVFKKSTKLYQGSIYYGGLFSKSIDNEKYVYQFQNDSIIALANTSWGDSFIQNLYSAETNSYYCGNNGEFLRLFPHIKKYPRLFYGSNSNSIFALQQDRFGQIWAGSYQGVLSIIANSNNKVIQSKTSTIKFLNGGLNYKNKMLFFGESLRGLLCYDGVETNKVVTDRFSGYYAYISKNKKLYLGTAQKGLWFTDIKSLDSKNKFEWTKISEKQGMTIENVLTISEDRFGNIWSGGNGISAYNPTTKKAITWKSNDMQSREYLRSRASILDTYNTLWFGTKNGSLIFYEGKNASDFNIKNFSFIKHPLLENGKTITFIHQWKDFLILGATDKVLLFDLQKWYTSKTVAIRYLNPMEINLTSNTEQNTILTDNRDKSIWFSTSDNLYQWDIKKWLSLPTFKVVPAILIQKDSLETEFKVGKCVNFKPSENSFDIQIKFQTKDNMPRFINGLLVKKGEKPLFEHPNLETKFQFKNISAGDYVFYVRVCQQDGSFTIFDYPITVDSFIWSKWWFWTLLMLPFLGIIIYFFQTRNEIEKQKKRLSQLNLSSLSNQFRPHFMLNALNSIGSQMQGKPHAEKVISRLGESINILYGFTQKNEFTLAFYDEWKLVENSIEIQRLLFMSDLKYSVKNSNLISIDYKIPVGLLQIPVENALLHGLRNKTDGNCVLEIEFEENEKQYFITITDNGVGREKANQINNFKKNGNGLKTIFEMIALINHHQNKAINFEIMNKEKTSGTIVQITMNKNIDYDKIKL